MKNEQFEKDIEVVPGIYNGLTIVEAGGKKFLIGELPIADTNGKLWEKYQIEIKGSDSYPYSFPKLFETADAFPHNADWHVHEDDFSCCVDYPANAKILCKNGLHITDYIKNYAIPHISQIRLSELERDIIAMWNTLTEFLERLNTIKAN
jgi:hypothetical protein